MIWLKRAVLILLVVGLLTGIMGCSTQTPEATIPEEPIPTQDLTPTTESMSTKEPMSTTEPVPTVDPMKEAYKSDPAGFVEFSRSTEPREQYVPISELLEYETQYPDCNGTWYRNQLSGEELIIYNSFLYALENRFIGFTVYVEDSSKDFSYIREMASLDSPFLEQNYTHYEYISKWPTNYVGQRIFVRMEQFTDSRWEMKMEALAKCRQIVENIPEECETQQAKMEYLYDYVCDNVEYTEYEKMADESYFYDAVCNGKSLCDGYSNMLSLLFHLIGVECCEVMGYSAQGKSGHTWVVAKLDGEFYNFDATYEDTGGAQTDRRIYFGFSDQLIDKYELDHEEMRPKCTDTSRDFSYADLVVSSFTDWDEVKKIVELTEQRLDMGENVTLIGVKSVVDSDQIDLFFERISSYATKSYGISVSSWDMENVSVIEVTLTPQYEG